MQKIIVQLLDDLDESEAAGTVKFAFDGVSYEIDLSEQNHTKMARLLQPYVKAARRTGGRQITGSKTKSKAAQIRDWAAGKGIDVGPTGKIPKAITEQYDAEHAAA